MTTELTFRFVTEDEPADGWRSIVDHGWPGWRSWYRARGGREGPDAVACRMALARYMPGIGPLVDSLVEAAGGDEEMARFLSFWSPPRYLVNCTQLATCDREGPLLIRNYDLDPRLNETTMLRSRWLGRGVIGMVEGLLGLSDGMNDRGLAISLTFGGRVVRGRGFGIPLIIRYLLETCDAVRDAVDELRRLPCHMSYNVTLGDASGDVATVMLSPDRPPMVSKAPWAANHQLGVEWPRHGRMTRTLERAERLDRLMSRGAVDAATLERTFLSEPVYSGRYANGFGTVFTTIYRPATGTVKVRWLKGVAETWDFESAPPRPIRVYYREGSSRAFRREANRTTARHVTTDREANLEGVASTSREGGTRQ